MKLLKSGINQKKEVKKTLKALGLTRIGKVRTYKQCAALTGMIQSVRHLVEVSEEK